MVTKKVSSILESYVRSNPEPITSTEELIEVLQLGFDNTDKHSTQPSDTKHLIIVMEQLPVCKEIEIDTMSPTLFSDAHSFVFAKDQILVKADSLSKHGILQKNPKIKRSTFQRICKLASPIEKIKFNPVLTKRSLNKIQRVHPLKQLVII